MAKFKLQRKEDVWQAIRRRGKEIASKLSDKEIFLSEAFRLYATHLADFILRKHKLFSLDLCYDAREDAPIAFTDGKKIVLNTGNCLASKPKLLERRFKVNMGILFHECAHKLFISFKASQEILDTLLDGKLYGEFAAQLTPEQQTAVEEMEAVIASPYREALAKLFMHICNCVDDGHDEAAMKRCFPGFVANCITAAGEVQLETSPTIEELISKRVSDFHIYTNLILLFAKYGEYKVGSGSAAEEAYLAKMQEVEPVIDAALLEDDYRKRWNHINLLMLFLWPYIRDQFPDDPQNQQSSQGSQQQPSQGGSGGSGGGQSGGGNQQQQSAGNGSGGGQQPSQGGSDEQSNDGSNGQGNDSSDAGSDDGSAGAPPPSPEEAQQAVDALLQQLSDMFQSAPQPVNGSGEAVDASQIKGGSMPDSGSDALGQMVQSVSEEKAAGQIQKELDKAQMEAIRGVNLPLIHKQADVHIHRHNPTNEHKYRQISQEIAPYVRNLSKQMLDLFREMNEEAVQHHRRYGPIVEATEAYRPDKAFFAKKKLPDDMPDMAMCVLIDQSGSMYGSKLEAAIRTAILLEQFADNVGIPLMVAGHDVHGGVNLRIFTDYASATTQQDKYSLAGIDDGGCNRDGLPLRLCCELLEQRPERVRLLVVISDGSPNDTGYRGEEARKDISDTVSQFRRKGMLIYGAAIDEDREIIQSIYGQGFLSIENLDLLPRTLVRLVKQQMT